MKKIFSIFLILSTLIIFGGGCRSNLSQSSSAEDSASYAIGALWGFTAKEKGLDFIDVDEVFASMKKSVSAPPSKENNYYMADVELAKYLSHNKTIDKKYVSQKMGIIWAQQFKETKIQRLNINLAKRGIKDFFAGDTSKMQMSIEASSEYVQKYIKEVEKQNNLERLKNGENFLEANKTKTGVVELPSGLQYKIITEGSGAKATEKDTALINSIVTDVKGDTIEIKKNKKILVEENRTIAGLVEGLKLFGEGSKVILYIPSKLAFGELIQPWMSVNIKPNMLVIYEIEIQKILTQKK